VISLKSHRKIARHLKKSVPRPRIKTVTSRSFRVWEDFADWLNRICFSFKTSVPLVHMCVTRRKFDVLQCFGKLARRKSDAKLWLRKYQFYFMEGLWEAISALHCRSGNQLLESSRLNEMWNRRHKPHGLSSRISASARNNLTSHCCRHRCDGSRQN